MAMSKTAEQLRSIKPGKSSRIRGQEVKRDGDRYVIEGEEFSLDDATTHLDQSNPTKSGVDYNWTVFLECPPGLNLCPIRHHRCRSKADHTELIEAVKKRKNYLWYGAVKKVDGKYQVHPPFMIDWESVPEHPDEVKKQEEQAAKPKDPKRWDGGLSCSFCGVEVSSTPGRTLHVKAAHPERLEEYQALLAEKTHGRLESEDNEDDVVNRQTEFNEVNFLKCPFCGAKVSSTSGRTLHVQGKHPDKLQEYQKLLVGGKL